MAVRNGDENFRARRERQGAWQNGKPTDNWSARSGGGGGGARVRLRKISPLPRKILKEKIKEHLFR